MNGVKIYQTANGWIYEIWYLGRAIIVGCSATLADATLEAQTAGTPGLPALSENS